MHLAPSLPFELLCRTRRTRSPTILDYIGYAAGALTVVSFLPQVFRTWRTRQVKDLSLGMFALLITAGALWITYGVLSSDAPVIATNVGMVGLNGAILVAKLRFG